jgi:LL-diaminopimelate aminotransferase
MEQTNADILYYLDNARTIRTGLEKAGLSVFGGQNAPYIWAGTPDGMDSWSFFDLLLREANVVATPGAGFGPCGEGYIRFSSFGEAARIPTAMERIQKVLGK